MKVIVTGVFFQMQSKMQVMWTLLLPNLSNKETVINTAFRNDGNTTNWMTIKPTSSSKRSRRRQATSDQQTSVRSKRELAWLFFCLIIRASLQSGRLRFHFSTLCVRLSVEGVTLSQCYNWKLRSVLKTTLWSFSDNYTN